MRPASPGGMARRYLKSVGSSDAPTVGSGGAAAAAFSRRCARAALPRPRRRRRRCADCRAPLRGRSAAGERRVAVARGQTRPVGLEVDPGQVGEDRLSRPARPAEGCLHRPRRDRAAARPAADRHRSDAAVSDALDDPAERAAAEQNRHRLGARQTRLVHRGVAQHVTAAEVEFERGDRQMRRRAGGRGSGCGPARSDGVRRRVRRQRRRGDDAGDQRAPTRPMAAARDRCSCRPR